jgi:dihydrofolate synthase / folylpolyglutamate synthase
VSYESTLRRLYELGRFGVRLGLGRMETILERLGRPHRQFPSVHLAGTNGKGSTAAMLASSLAVEGYRVGLYTSPHLCRFTERIRIAGQEIHGTALERLVDRVLELDPELTFFEAATATAFAYFAEERIDIAVVETGLGGRLDATNVLEPLVSVLTRIDLDHVEILGPTQARVAREKAGIIKQGVPVVSAAAKPEVEAVIGQRCEELHSRLRLQGRDFQIFPDRAGLSYRSSSWLLDGIDLGLAGTYQHENASLCLATLEVLREQGLHVEEESIRGGLAQVRWPGRMEWIGDYLLDGAHNPSGTAALSASLDGGRDFCLIAGLLGPKNPMEVLGPLLPRAGRRIFTRPRNPRAISPEALSQGVPGSEIAEDLPAALEKARRDPRPKLITGSLYLVGEARSLLLAEPVDPFQTGDPLPTTRSNDLGGFLASRDPLR